jgi:hypothetical protein
MFRDISPLFEFPSLKVNFEFNPTTEIYLDISPNGGGRLRAHTTTVEPPLGMLPTQRMNEYEFFYDLSFPVIVTIRDNESLRSKGESGYTFRFAFEANIRDNKDLLQWNKGFGTIGKLDKSPVQVVVDLQEQDSGNCIEEGTQWRCALDNSLHSGLVACGSNCLTPEQTVQIFPSTPSLECDPLQKISGTHSIKVKDIETDLGVERMQITYTCGNAKACPLGITDEEGIWEGKSQMCFGQGRLSIIKPGFESIIKQQQILAGESVSIDRKIHQYQDKSVELVLINLSNMFRVERFLDSLLNKLDLPLSINGLAQNGELSHPALIRFIHRYPGTAQVEVLKALKKLQDKECICVTRNPTCNPCTKANVPADKLLPEEIESIVSRFNLPTLAIYEYKIAKTLLEIDYITELHDARLLTLGVDHYFDVDPTKTADSLRKTNNAISGTNDYLKAISNDPALIKSLVGRNNFNVESLEVQDITKTRMAEWSKKLNHESENLRIRTPSESASSSIVNQYRNDAWLLRPTDEAIIRLEKVKSNPTEPSLPLGTAIINEKESTNFTLVPGEYTVDIFLQHLPGHLIEKEDLLTTINMPGGGSIITGEDINHTYVGGSKITTNNGYLTMTNDDLKNNNKIRFYAFHLDIPENAEDFGDIGKLEEYSNQYRAYIEPEFLP